MLLFEGSCNWEIKAGWGERSESGWWEVAGSGGLGVRGARGARCFRVGEGRTGQLEKVISEKLYGSIGIIGINRLEAGIHHHQG